MVACRGVRRSCNWVRLTCRPARAVSIRVRSSAVSRCSQHPNVRSACSNPAPARVGPPSRYPGFKPMPGARLRYFVGSAEALAVLGAAAWKTAPPTRLSSTTTQGSCPKSNVLRPLCRSSGLTTGNAATPCVSCSLRPSNPRFAGDCCRAPGRQSARPRQGEKRAAGQLAEASGPEEGSARPDSERLHCDGRANS